jgi:hypothetical protein
VLLLVVGIKKNKSDNLPVNVRVMTVGSFIFNMSSGDGDTSSSLFWSLVDGRVVQESGTTLGSETLSDGSGQSGLTMINVTNGTNVQMWFGTLERTSVTDQ